MENNSKASASDKRITVPSGGKLFYIILTLCVAAAGLGAWSTVTKDSSDTPSSTFTVPEYEYNYELPTVTIVYDDEQRVNAPATNVPDNRDEPSEAQSEQPDNLPYTGTFALPAGDIIIKDFSNGEMMKSETMGDWRVHNGIDFGENRGQSILAIHDGTVTAVFDDELWGTVLIIDHGNGLVARYCGLVSGSTPENGSAVERHEIIGKLGEIPVESADGPHLHLEVTVDGKIVDPLKAMNMQ